MQYNRLTARLVRLVDSLAGRTRKLLKGAGTALAIRAGGMLAAYASRILLARLLGAATYGLVAYSLSWASLCGILFTAGVPVAALRAVNQYNHPSAGAPIRTITVRSYVTVITISLAAAATLYIVQSQSLGVVSKPLLSIATAAGILFAIPEALTRLQTQLWRSLRHIGLAYIFPRIVKPTLLVAAAALYTTAYVDRTDTSLFLLLGIALTLVALVQGGPLITHLRRLPTEIGLPEPPNWRQLLSTAIPLLIASGSAIAMTRVDMIILGNMVDSDTVGIYNAASLTAGAIEVYLFAVSAIATPTIASMYTDKSISREQLATYLSDTSRWIFWPALMTFIIFILTGEGLLTLFGARFVEGYPLLLILGVGQLVQAATGLTGATLNMTGQERITALVYSTAAILNAVLNYLMISRWGAIGAAVATSLSLALANIALERLCRRRVRLSPAVYKSPGD